MNNWPKNWREHGPCEFKYFECKNKRRTKMISRMGETESRALLSEKITGRLGCSDRDKPYVIPVNYLFDGECIYVHALPGRKINVLRANPNACLQVDEIKDSYNWRSVIAFGHYEEIVNENERELI